MKRAADFFTSPERERIRQAVHAAESATTGEIATMIVDESDPYRDTVVLGAVLLAGFLGLVLAVLFHHVTIWFYIPLVFVLYFPCYIIFDRSPVLKRPLLSPQRVSQTVRERALRAFYEKGVYRTRDATGILIFISLLERKVWILGDRGINSKIAPDSWQGLARELSEGLREKRACAALCSIIDTCGKLLAEHFPPKGDDANELPDELATEEIAGR